MRISGRLSICSVAVFVTLIASTFSFAGSQDLNAKLNSGSFIQNANNFMVIFDRSGSMGDYLGSERKINIEKKLVGLFNATVPDLKLDAGMREFGENCYNFDVTKLDYGVTAYNREALGSIIAKKRGPFGNSPLDVAIKAAGSDLKSAQGKSALVIFTDGLDMDEAVVKAATAVKGEYGDRLCIYTVQIGNDAAAAKLLDKVAAAGECGIAEKGDKVADDAGMTAFVEKIFLAAKPPEPPKPVVVAPPPPPPPVVEERKPAPAAAAEVKEPEKVTIKLNVQFDTGKAIVKPKYKQEIKKVADFMKKYPNSTATIEGHTDNVGKEAANMKLSQKRADAVANYLVKQFKVDKSRVKAIGYGPTRPVADNATKAGKQQNRRVDAVMESM